MRTTLIAMLLLVVACAPGEQSETAAEPSEAATAAEHASTGSGYYSVEELLDLRLRAVDPDGDRFLLCGEGEEDEASCVCMEPLPCEARGDCILFDDNIEAFRAAVQRGQEDRTVDCVRGETGRCGEFRYFYFEGDIERREMRWFDPSGTMVAQRNWTDYREYCDGRTRVRFMGSIPKCSPMEREELICGEAENPLLDPIEDLRRYTLGRARPE